MTQNQLIELFESEHVKALIERAEEHGGQLEAPELEAFVLEHDLGDEDVELLPRELEAHDIEIAQPDADAEKEEARREAATRPAPSPAPPTASSCSSPTSAATSCSPPPRRSRSRSASSAATRSPSA